LVRKVIAVILYALTTTRMCVRCISSSEILFGLTSGTCLGVWKAMWLFMNDEFMVRLGYTRADEEEGLNWETHILGSRILYDRVWEIGSERTGRNF
jgi:hypothetical protein